ncbi:winged helix-turn-helix domain-containing protein [Micromonospora peucetia]|uniref:Transcriptional regulatory protein, C terminal n=1 Tax=Micromonospora peucetia TaxID=47871 RepID=A0A1C6W3Z9_9ACTN|nr:winged helix-turn-helix domain-containing protein [Micromonospora peucetia]MCX4390428.1 winged helix-turn-helix domain-containing protein [Micromonospora peucetia]WSA32275.1 winged helix-turn-helix domain-containing protein [Micromonospora peucetia]SCL73134.1 Transcriptional regulatory protein, C terminal [Micromonospora peucetia]
MSVSPASSRAGWHTSQPAVPGRPPGGQRRPANTAAPMLTVTLNIPLASEESLTPPARRLLEAAREMLERGEGTIIAPASVERRPEPVPAGRPPSRPVAAMVPTLHILASSRSVLRDGEPLPLTRLEFDLLLHLVAHPRRVFTRLQLLNAVWGYEHAGVRTVDVHVRRLRGKVGVDVPLVTTVYGVGYRLADDAHVTIDRNG